MYDINDITDYVILSLTQDDKPTLINLKLQKILYYLQAWHWGIYNEPLFKGEFQAWAHGPVNVEIYNRFKDTKTLYSFICFNDVINHEPDIESNDKDYIDWILENYAPFTGVELERMTHNEEPWRIARNGIGQWEICKNIISESSMKKYYGKRWEELGNN